MELNRREWRRRPARRAAARTAASDGHFAAACRPDYGRPGRQQSAGTGFKEEEKTQEEEEEVDTRRKERRRRRSRSVASREWRRPWPRLPRWCKDLLAAKWERSAPPRGLVPARQRLLMRFVAVQLLARAPWADNAQRLLAHLGWSRAAQGSAAGAWPTWAAAV